MNRLRPYVLLGFLLLLAACSRPLPAPTVVTAVTSVPTPTAMLAGTPAPASTLASTSTPLPTGTPTATATPVATATPAPTSTRTPTTTSTPSPSPSPSPASTPTPDPYAGLSIADLAARSYGDGELQVTQTLAASKAFTRELISYASDGLAIAGFMNTPRKEGPLPVVIVLHGYVEPSRYRTLTYTTPYADALARAGYLVIHPNLRNFPPSDKGDERFRVGQAIDVLNLIALIQKQGGQPGPLQAADPQRIGLWGHSMGGGISTRVLTLNPDVRAAVLYGAMSGDERRNYEKIAVWSGNLRNQWELTVPEADLQRISPVHFLDRVAAAVSIHHGDADATVPPAWSADLCQRLQALGKQVECFSYPGQPHTFIGEGNSLFIRRTIDFFDRHLR